MKKIALISIVLCACIGTMAQTEKFCIAHEGKTASIVLDVDDWKGVIRAARNLGDDVRKVTGVASQIDLQSPNSAGLLPHERKNLQASILVGTTERAVSSSSSKSLSIPTTLSTAISVQGINNYFILNNEIPSDWLPLSYCRAPSDDGGSHSRLSENVS